MTAGPFGPPAAHLHPVDLLLTIERAGRRGQRFGLGDLLIAALANEVGALVWSLDTGFARMEKLALVRRYEP